MNLNNLVSSNSQPLNTLEAMHPSMATALCETNTESRSNGSSRLDTSSPVKLLLGLDEVEFTADRSVLCNCPYFKARLSGRWSGDLNVVKLEDEEPEIFGEYMKFLSLQSTAELPNNLAEVLARCELLVLTYVLADYLSDSRTANAIMDEFIRIHVGLASYRDPRDPGLLLPRPHIVEIVFESCNDTSPMYWYVVEASVYSGSTAVCELYEGKVPAEFWLAVTKAMLTVFDWAGEYDTLFQTFNGRNLIRDPCRFHRHDDNICPYGDCCKESMLDKLEADARAAAIEEAKEKSNTDGEW